MRSMVLLGFLALGGVLCTRAANAGVIVLHGKGVQIYGCTQAEAGYAWHLKAPDAVLTDSAGHTIGHHFAGPSWQAKDGSTVTGNLLNTSQAPQADAIPWLVLGAKDHTGNGLFNKVSYIVRSATKGGAAPSTGCNLAHAGVEVRIYYSATYIFFSE